MNALKCWSNRRVSPELKMNRITVSGLREFQLTSLSLCVTARVCVCSVTRQCIVSRGSIPPCSFVSRAHFLILIITADANDIGDKHLLFVGHTMTREVFFYSCNVPSLVIIAAEIMKCTSNGRLLALACAHA